LQFRLAAGDDQDRQILSGIAEFYPEPQDLIGKKVVIVANLKPRKMRGQISQGMILSAEDNDGRLQIVEAPKGMPNGSIIARFLGEILLLVSTKIKLPDLESFCIM